MNSAYKWYSYNNNIIQFYSESSDSKTRKPLNDNVKETVEQACSYASGIVESNNNITINY